MENTYFKGETRKRDIGFIGSLLVFSIFMVMGIGIDVDAFLQHKSADVHIPSWYFTLIFLIDFFVLLAIGLIYFYRKWGIYFYPISVGFHFIFHLYFLDTFLYSDVFSIFAFIGIGLLAFIPQWQFFK